MTPTSSEPEAIFHLQQGARWRLAATGHRDRARRLRRLQAALLARRGEAQAALALDFGKPAEEVDLTELYPVLAEIRHALRHLRSWMKPRRVGNPLTYFGTASSIRPEPKGVVLVISPWNYPLFLALGPLVSALAAGNCVILKPSEFTPHANAFLKSLLGDCFPQEEVAVLEGAAETAQALLALPFDHIFFTGSPAVGKRVMAAAAEHLCPVTLELGGKSPVLVDAGADPADAARKIAWGKFLNAGQTCVAPDYVLVHADLHDRLVAELARAVRSFYGPGPEQWQASPDFARIISRRHLDRLTGLLAASGGEIVLGGQSDPAINYLAPTLVTGVAADSPLMAEEIFGPILPILKVGDLEAAIRFVNARPKPLALYVFSDRPARAEAVLAATTAGGSCVNDTVLHFAHPNLPGGGVGPSGFGKAHGVHGFQAFSNSRGVVRQRTRFSLARMLYPPFTARIRRLLGLMLRFF
jgi:aldehyde dehydrogenase (NAD+)